MRSGRLRAAGLIALGLGAALSAGLTLYHGRRAPGFLVVLFVGWVLAPFAALALGDKLSARWSEQARAGLYGAMIVVSAITPAVYAYTAFSPRPQSAFIFVVVPPASWVLALALVLIGAAIAKRRNRV